MFHLYYPVLEKLAFQSRRLPNCVCERMGATTVVVAVRRSKVQACKFQLNSLESRDTSM